MERSGVAAPVRLRGRPRGSRKPRFAVPFCSNPNCPCFHHPPPATQWCVDHGVYHTKAHGTVARARCLICGKTFSRQTYQVSYYTKVHVDLARMLLELVGGASVRGISRAHGCSFGSIVNRIDRLCRQAITMHQDVLGRLCLREALVADGFVDFTVSQYFPDVVTMVSGKRTQMIYNFAHCVVRRRGRMTEEQRHHRHVLETVYRAEAHGERDALAEVLIDTLSVIDTMGRKVELYTDEHTEYPPAIRRLRSVLPHFKRADQFSHYRVNSRVAHAQRSPLFSANYLDRQLRLSLAAHRRETICFGRNESSNLARLVLYMVWHNYNKPYRINGRSEQPPPHAVVAGADANRISQWWELFFQRRVIFMKAQPEGYLRRIWLKTVYTPLKARPEYLPKYAYA